MQQKNRPAEYTAICFHIGASVPWNSTQQIPPSAAIKARVNGARAYQRGLSKQMIKLKRYSASGRTHRNGITATSWHILLVVAMSNTELHAGSSSQSSRVNAEGGAAETEGGGSGAEGRRPEVTPESKGLLTPALSPSDGGRSPPALSAFQNFTAQKPQLTAYTTSPQPHSTAWEWRGRWDSKKKG